MAYNDPLPFGGRNAVMHLDPRHAADALNGYNRKLLSFEAVGDSKFTSRTAAALIGNTWLSTHVGSPCNFAFDHGEGSFLVVPFVGSGSMTSEGRTFNITAGTNAAVFPNTRRAFRRDFGSSVIVSVDIGAIKELIRTSFPEDANGIYFAESMSIDFLKNASRFRSFAAICNLIDSQFDNVLALQILGVEDLINRWIVSCLLPPGDLQGARVESQRLDIVCDLVRASVYRPLTLTEMERVSDLSARALQYAFMARFGCSPMQWQRRERLLSARQRVLAMGPDESITTIAHALGYSSSSAFSALYKRQFGETPSETILRNK